MLSDLFVALSVRHLLPPLTPAGPVGGVCAGPAASCFRLRQVWLRPAPQCSCPPSSKRACAVLPPLVRRLTTASAPGGTLPAPSRRSPAALSATVPFRASPSVKRMLACIPAVSTGLSVSRSEEHTSELQSLMRISYAVFCLKKKK